MTRLMVQERKTIVGVAERANALKLVRRPTRILLAGGIRGERGQAGEDGASAYQLWLAAGHQGTEEEFLANLRGAKGDPGSPGQNGENGLSAYEAWLSAGNAGTEQDFLNSLKGANGDPGDDGDPGASAYDVWLGAGHQGSEAEFLASLVGPQGPSSVLAGHVAVTQNFTSLTYAEVAGLSVTLPSTGIYQLILVILHSNEADADLRWRLQAVQCTATAHLQTVFSATNQAQTALGGTISVTVASDQANRITTIIGVINVTAIGGSAPRIYVDASAGTAGSAVPSSINVGSCMTLTKVS